jgi:hypothetical protein
MLVSELLVNDSNGLIDIQATLNSFRPLLVAARAEQEKRANSVATAIGAVFDQWKGTRIKIKDLVVYVIGKMNAPPDAMKQVDTDVRAFIAANSDIYNLIPKGKGCGVARICDIPVKALPAPKAKRASKKSTKPVETAVQPVDVAAQ